MSELRVLLATTLVPDDRKVLACVRALGRAGVWVAVASDSLWGEAGYSRHVRRRLRYPHPAREPDAFLGALCEHLDRHRIQVVLPTNDYTTLALSRFRDRLPAGVRTALPSAEAIDLARDKSRTLALAAELGIDIPATCEPADDEELEEIAAGLAYPCVLKLNSGAGAVGIAFPRDARELLEACRRPRRAADAVFDYQRLLIQEYLPGETHDACVVCCHGEIRAGLTQHRRWMYPPTGGMGISVETGHDTALLDQAARILAALRWHGPAIVEFRVDPRSGRRSLIEVNGRLGGASDAGIRAGINYPLLWTRLALDGDVPAQSGHRVGMRFRWPIPFGLLAFRSASPRAVAREFFMPARDTYSDFSIRDPLPHLAEAVYALRRIMAR
jgi:predicted ATP-grasp superfamily ATP-dependent carboligase